MSNYYEILGVARDATVDKIKAQYKKLCLENHPDKHTDNKEYYEKMFKLINEAYDCLSDPQKKRNYDFKLKEHLQGQSSNKRQKCDTQNVGKEDDGITIPGYQITILPPDKCIYIFDFDCTITKNHTFRNEYYYKTLDSVFIKKNVTNLNEFKEFVIKAHEQGHKIAIATFSNQHQYSSDNCKGGIHLVRHYLQVIFADNPVVGNSIIIQAFNNGFKNKNEHIINITNALKATTNQVVFLDDDAGNVNAQLHVNSSWLVTRDNHLKLMQMLIESLKTPEVLINPIKHYFTPEETKLFNSSVFTDFQRIHQFIPYVDVEAKVIRLHKEMCEKSGNKDIIQRLINDSPTIERICFDQKFFDEFFKIYSFTNPKSSSFNIKFFLESNNKIYRKTFDKVDEPTKNIFFDAIKRTLNETKKSLIGELPLGQLISSKSTAGYLTNIMSLLRDEDDKINFAEALLLQSHYDCLYYFICENNILMKLSDNFYQQLFFILHQVNNSSNLKPIQTGNSQNDEKNKINIFINNISKNLDKMIEDSHLCDYEYALNYLKILFILNDCEIISSALKSFNVKNSKDFGLLVANFTKFLINLIKLSSSFFDSASPRQVIEKTLKELISCNPSNLILSYAELQKIILLADAEILRWFLKDQETLKICDGNINNLFGFCLSNARSCNNYEILFVFLLELDSKHFSVKLYDEKFKYIFQDDKLELQIRLIDIFNQKGVKVTPPSLEEMINFAIIHNNTVKIKSLMQSKEQVIGTEHLLLSLSDDNSYPKKLSTFCFLLQYIQPKDITLNFLLTILKQAVAAKFSSDALSFIFVKLALVSNFIFDEHIDQLLSALLSEATLENGYLTTAVHLMELGAKSNSDLVFFPPNIKSTEKENDGGESENEENSDYDSDNEEHKAKKIKQKLEQLLQVSIERNSKFAENDNAFFANQQNFEASLIAAIETGNIFQFKYLLQQAKASDLCQNYIKGINAAYLCTSFIAAFYNFYNLDDTYSVFENHYILKPIFEKFLDLFAENNWLEPLKDKNYLTSIFLNLVVVKENFTGELLLSMLFKKNIDIQEILKTNTYQSTASNSSVSKILKLNINNKTAEAEALNVPHIEAAKCHVIGSSPLFETSQIFNPFFRP